MLNTWRYNDSAIGCFARCFVLIGTMLFCVVHNASACDGIELSAEDYPIVQPSLASGAADSLAQYISGSAYTFCFSIQQIDLEGAPLVVRNLTNKALTIDGLKLKSSLPVTSAFIQLLGPGPIVLRNVSIVGNDTQTTSDQSTGLFIATDNATVTGSTSITNFFYGIDVTGSHTTIDGATITRTVEQPGSAGIFVRGGSGDNLSKLIVTGFDTGIVLLGAQQSVQGSAITGAKILKSNTLLSDAGIFVRGDGSQLAANTISNFKHGIVIDPLSKAPTVVTGGKISYADVGVWFTKNLSTTSAVFDVAPDTFLHASELMAQEVPSSAADPLNKIDLAKRCHFSKTVELNGTKVNQCITTENAVTADEQQQAASNYIDYLTGVVPEQFCDAAKLSSKIYLYTHQGMSSDDKKNPYNLAGSCVFAKYDSALQMMSPDGQSAAGNVENGACGLQCQMGIAGAGLHLWQHDYINYYIESSAGLYRLSQAVLVQNLKLITAIGQPVFIPSPGAGASTDSGGISGGVVPGVGSEAQPLGLDGGSGAAAGGNSGGTSVAPDAASGGVAGAAGAGTVTAAGGGDQVDGGGVSGTVGNNAGDNSSSSNDAGAATGNAGNAGTQGAGNSNIGGGATIAAAAAAATASSVDGDEPTKPAGSGTSVSSSGLDGGSIGPGPGQGGGLGGGGMSAGGCSLVIRIH